MSETVHDNCGPSGGGTPAEYGAGLDLAIKQGRFQSCKVHPGQRGAFRLTKCARAMTRAGYAKTVPTTVRLEGFNQWKEDIADASLGPDEVWRTRIDLQFTPQS